MPRRRNSEHDDCHEDDSASNRIRAGDSYARNTRLQSATSARTANCPRRAERSRASTQTKKPRIHAALAHKPGKSCERKAPLRRYAMAAKVGARDTAAARRRNSYVRVLPSGIRDADRPTAAHGKRFQESRVTVLRTLLRPQSSARGDSETGKLRL